MQDVGLVPVVTNREGFCPVCPNIAKRNLKTVLRDNSLPVLTVVMVDLPVKAYAEKVVRAASAHPDDARTVKHTNPRTVFLLVYTPISTVERAIDGREPGTELRDDVAHRDAGRIYHTAGRSVEMVQIVESRIQGLHHIVSVSCDVDVVRCKAAYAGDLDALGGYEHGEVCPTRPVEMEERVHASGPYVRG